MTGPEHYQCAESYGREADAQLASGNLDEARVYAELGTLHATLANAAATAMSGRNEGMHPSDFAAWDRAAGVPVSDGGDA
ncbi:hypothetical protein ACFW08_20060 [Streptomyces sp. NPDC058960]|uniref:hypothetical protein n=1 Tax=Streptomyces sp. NPDC058960 TaxID=3346679 RepID=UPI00367EA2E0